MTDKQTRPELEYERDWCRSKIKELQAKYEHAYNALLAEQKENAALVEAASDAKATIAKQAALMQRIVDLNKQPLTQDNTVPILAAMDKAIDDMAKYLDKC